MSCGKWQDGVSPILPEMTAAWRTGGDVFFHKDDHFIGQVALISHGNRGFPARSTQPYWKVFAVGGGLRALGCTFFVSRTKNTVGIESGSE